jgi:tRNA(Ile)-lysidine synthase
MPAAAARRLVRYAIHLVKGHLRRIEFDHVLRVLELAGAPARPGRLDLPGVQVQRSFDWLRVSVDVSPRVYPPQWVKVPGRYDAPDGNSLILLNLLPRRSYATLKMELSWRKLPREMELRAWKPGDAYRPQGQSRERKLKEMFQEARVPSWRRAGWPILTGEGKILWTREFGVAEEFRAAGRGGSVRISETQVG